MFIRTLQNRIIALFGLATVVVVCTGCPSVPTLTTAKTVGVGVNEITISPGFVGFAAAATGASGSASTGLLSIPDLAFSYRRGFGDSVDAAVTLSGWGHLRLDGKYNFLGNEKGDAFALAINPGVGGVFVGSGDVAGGYVDFTIPVPMDIAFTDWMRMTLQPRYMGIVAFGGGETAATHFVGAGMGLEFVVNETVALQPHGGFDLMMNPPGTGEVGTDFMLATGGFAIKLRF